MSEFQLAHHNRIAKVLGAFSPSLSIQMITYSSIEKLNRRFLYLRFNPIYNITFSAAP
ncbi:hypothetical protein [Pectobacterium brasiliense]|uniref:hypothetical protein n=1 Tax=Pectobacterium brasiliense TaxID=180957 RepID=UPI0013F3DC39|nr:hypothetical protein [Pectobacterium brasiliense]